MKLLILRLAKTLLSLPVYFVVMPLMVYEACLKIIIGVKAMKVRDPILNWISRSHMLVNIPYRQTHVGLKLLTPNYISAYRATSYFDKEPEILEWMDEFGHLGSFFDIGANVGLYSMYYLSTQSGNVYSFEPSPFNLKSLAVHLSNNGFSDRGFLVPLPLTNNDGFKRLNFGSFDEGGALNAFGVDFDQNGDKFAGVASVMMLGCSIDFLFDRGLIEEVPAIVKVDVDGIEHLILAGAMNVLSSPKCKSVYVEVNDSFTDQARGVASILVECGFELREKRKESSEGDTYNQIWVKRT